MPPGSPLRNRCVGPSDANARIMGAHLTERNQEVKQAVSLAKGELTLTQVTPNATTVSVYRRAK